MSAAHRHRSASHKVIRLARSTAGLVLSLLVAGCVGDDVAAGTSATSSTTEPPPGPIRFLAMGDSYTIGEGVAPAERWPVILAARLEDEDIVESVDVQIVARTGWTTDELDAALDQAVPEGPFELVSLLIGVNNQFRGLPLDSFRGEFVGLLQRAIGFAGEDPRRVIVISIPDWSITPTGERYDPGDVAGSEIDRFNVVAEEETRRIGAHWVDVTSISRSAEGTVASDGLHPSGGQYRRWVDVILPVVRELLARSI